MELFEDEHGNPRGCGIIEFEKVEHARIALDKMHRYDLKGRKLVVKEVRIITVILLFYMQNRSTIDVGSLWGLVVCFVSNERAGKIQATDCS